MDDAAKLVASGMKFMVTEIQKNTLKKLNDTTKDSYYSAFPTERQDLKKAMDKVNDSTACLFRNIIDKLYEMSSGMLKSSIPKMINSPACATEDLVSSLLGQLTGLISSGLNDFMKPLSALGSISGDGFKVPTFGGDDVLGTVTDLLSFLDCDENPDCNEVKEWNVAEGPLAAPRISLGSIVSKAKEKASLIATVGAGGNAGGTGGGANGRKGGFGGGVDIEGQVGSGNNGGSGGGGQSITGNGVFGSDFTASVVYPGDSQASSDGSGGPGGRTISCTKGVYWAQQGIGACDDIGTGKFRLSDGTIVTNTVSGITRGYKAGYNIIQTGGVSLTSNGGNGGCGVAGGSGTQNGSGGGGGGSGYHDGSVTVVDTRLGGSTGDGKVVLRLQT